jgi:phage FluMu gp28-like protein
MDEAEKKQYLDLVDELQEKRGKQVEEAGLIDDVPHILLSYQSEWHQDGAEVRVGEESRRIGFTWGAMSAEAVLEAAEEDGMDQFYIGYNLPMAAEFIGDCAFFAKAFGQVASAIDVGMEQIIIANEKRDVLRYRIYLSNGKKIEALSSNPHNFRGRQGHIRIDEAAFHPSLGELIKAAIAHLIWGGRVDIVSTHNGDENEFNQLIQEILAKKIDYSLHRVTLDDALRAGLYKRICLVRRLEWSPEAEKKFREKIYASYPDSAMAEEELGCIPRRGSGAYMPRVLVESCQKDGIPILYIGKPAEWFLDARRFEETDKWIQDVLKPVIDNLPTDRRTVLGQDFGRDGDLSDIWILQETDNKRWRTGFLLEMRRIPFDIQQKILFYIMDELPLMHHAKFDARGNGQSHAEAAQQKYGVMRVECVMLTQSWYAANFPRYRSAYEDGSIEAPKSEDVIADHRRVVLNKGIPSIDDGRDKGSDGGYRHGDSAVAGVLAWAATRQEGQPAAGSTVEPEPDHMVPQAMLGRRRMVMRGRAGMTMRQQA